jgi:hypothetical protein
MRQLSLAVCMLSCVLIGSAQAGPAYDHDRKELEEVMARLIAWLPGSWDSFPQVYYERTVRMPAEGEHEHWHRVFARIDAPQVGDVVFYGQINVGGRDGAIMGRSQVLYKAVIDEARGVVSITGQSPAEPEKFENLHERPELWRKVRMLNESAVRCDFVWRRRGTQIFGVVDGKTPERRKHGPGTCSYVSENTGEEFVSDAEWVLEADQLWLYDSNTMGGQLFIGREDKTHVRLYRARPYTCDVGAGPDRRRLDAHDRGFAVDLGGGRSVLLMRAELPAKNGLEDRLRLILMADGKPVASADAAPLAEQIALDAQGVKASCRAATQFAPMHR